MYIEQFYKLIKEILQIEREGRSFPTHLKTLLGAYLEAYKDIDDSCFKEGAEERRDRYLFQIEYEQLDNKEVKECLGKLENHQEQVYIT